MKSILKSCAFLAVLIAVAVAAVFFAGNRFIFLDELSEQRAEKVLPDSCKRWFGKFQSDFDAEIAKVGDADVEAVYKNALKESNKGSATRPARAAVSGKEIRDWMARYVRSDLEPFLATVLANLPAAQRDLVMKRMLQRNAPKVRVAFHKGQMAHVKTDRSEDLSVNPAEIDGNYNVWRNVLGHEMIHYLLEGGGGGLELKSLYEAVTEFISARASGALGWPHELSYKDEVAAAGMLSLFMEKELLSWYFSDSRSDTNMMRKISSGLIDRGVPKEAAARLSKWWTETSLGEMKLLTLSLSVCELKLEQATLDMRAINLELAVRDWGFAKREYSIVRNFCATASVPWSSEETRFLEISVFRRGGALTGVSEVYSEEIAPLMRARLLGKPLPKKMKERQIRIASATTDVTDEVSKNVLLVVCDMEVERVSDSLRSELENLRRAVAELEKKRNKVTASIKELENKAPESLAIGTYSALRSAGYDIDSRIRRLPDSVRMVLEPLRK